jgi:hypothetical protein
LFNFYGIINNLFSDAPNISLRCDAEETKSVTSEYKVQEAELSHMPHNF